MKFTVSEKRTIERCFTIIKQNFEYLASDCIDEFQLDQDLYNLKNIIEKMD